MATTATRADRVREAPPPDTLGWPGLLRVTALSTLGVLAVAAMVLRDVEAAVVAAGFALAFGLLYVRRGLAGQLLLTPMFANVAGWMTLGAASNLVGGDGFVSLLFPAALTATSLTGLVAAVAVLATRRRQAPSSSRAPLWVAIGGSQVLIALLLAGALTGGWTGGGPVGDVDIALVAENAAFSETELAATAGEISVSMANNDLFWHTFTIEELDVNVNVPVNGERTATFAAAPGTYTFVCRIPGHESAGMVGTLVVR